MEKFTVENVEYELPKMGYVMADNDTLRFIIEEGELTGVEFGLSNLQMDESEEGLLHYDIDVDEASLEKVKPITEALILKILTDMANKKEYPQE